MRSSLNVIILSLLLAASSMVQGSISPLEDPPFDPEGWEDVPVWGPDDFWNYTTQFEYDAGMVSVGLSGWINMSVVLFTLDLLSNGDPVYITNLSGHISGKESTILGDIEIDIDITGYLWHRAQDLAVYRSVLNATVSGTVSFINGDYTIGYEYVPPLEEYDFPLVPGDTWDVNTSARLPFGGSGDLVPILQNCSLGTKRSMMVDAGTFDIFPILVNGEETLFYNGSVGNSILRSYTLDVGGSTLDIPLELSVFKHHRTSVQVDLEIVTEQQVWVTEDFTVHGEVSISNCLVSVFFPDGNIAKTTVLVGGDKDFDVVLKAPLDADDTPTLIDHASLGVLVVINTGEGIGVITVTTKAQELVVEEGDLWVEQDGNGTVDDMVRIGMRIHNPSNFDVQNFSMMLELIPTDRYGLVTSYGLSVPARSFIVLYLNDTFISPNFYDLSLTIDIYGQVTEINETNNRIQTNFTVLPRPSILWNLSHEPGPLNIEEGDMIHFSVEASRGGEELLGQWYLDGEVVSNSKDYDFLTTYDQNNSYRPYPYILRYELADNQTYPADHMTEIEYRINVTDVNRPHMIESYAPEGALISVLENMTVEFILNISEPDGDDLRYFWMVGNTSFEAFRNIHLHTEYLGANSSEDSPLNISVIVYDGRDHSFDLMRNWTLIIEDVDRPIEVSLDPLPGNSTLQYNGTLDIGYDAFDPDGTIILSEWNFLNLTITNETSILLDPSELGLEGGEVFDVDLVLWSGSEVHFFKWTVNVTLPEDQGPEPIEPVAPLGASIVSPAQGSSYPSNGTVLFKAVADDDRNLSFIWQVDGVEYIGMEFSISSLEQGDHSVLLNISSTEEERPGWIELSLTFEIEEPVKEDQEPEKEEENGSPIWIVVVAIAAVILIILFIVVLLFIRRRNDEMDWEE